MVKCRVCKEEINSGIFVESSFKEKTLFLFCSEKCKKELIKNRLRRIKAEYPKYYYKIKKKYKEKNLDEYRVVL